ncbi:MAG: carbohydrate ABC transporter permease [Anaerolineae bacterium]
MATFDSTTDTAPGLVPSARARGRRLGKKTQDALFRAAMYTILTVGGVTMLLPFIWMVSTSLKVYGREFSYPPELIPNPVVWSNYPDVLFGTANVIGLLRNTLIVTAASVSGAVLSASLAAYGFARIPFPGRNFWFMMLLSTMMLPGVVTIIPRFILYRSLHWIDTWLPLIVPAFFGGGAFNIFLLRQFFMTVPYDYDEAAKIDGASSLRIWAEVLLPLARPALATVAVLTFMGEWNSFMDPLIYISSYSKQMLGVGLALFRGLASSRWNLMMAGAFVQILPVLIVFFCAQQYIIRGIVLTGLSGR